MDFNFIKEVLNLIENFDTENKNNLYPATLDGFKSWIYNTEIQKNKDGEHETDWEGKESGRTPESVISTLLVHLNRYAKAYSKSAIADSEFSTQEDFIYLITLKAFGTMSKMDLIKKNIQDKPVGILIINRLLKQGWIEQKNSDKDKRTTLVTITEKGLETLENQMNKIRQASQIVSGNLTHTEKMELIRILDKLDQFHHPIYCKNIESKNLIDTVYREFSFEKN